MESYRRRPVTLALLLGAATIVGATTARAQTHQVDVNSLLVETQQTTPSMDAVTFVWWIPAEFWRATLEGSGQTEEQLEELLATLRPYTLVAAFDGAVGPFGGITYVLEPTLRESVWLVDGHGETYRPLPEEQIDPDTRNLIAAFTPMWASAMGELGEHMVPFVFPATDGHGHRIADPTKEGRFSVRVGQEEFTWRLPLASLVPPKFCPVDGELLSGAWKYCPWHGDELLDAADTVTPTALPPEHVVEPTGRITFASERAGNLEIYSMNADGTDQTRLTDSPGDEPASSPDGQFIAFTSCRDDNCDVYVVNYEGGHERRLTRHRAFDGTPAWSPDGRYIAFTSTRDGKHEIYVMDADGKNKRNLTNNPDERDSYPAWSPDGRFIAFHSTPGEGIPREIYVMTASGTDRRMLTANPALDWLPAWSPDGERIAFWSTRDDSWEMYVMNSDGTELRRLTNGPIRYSRALGGYSVSTPAWSPDGRFIAFASNPDDNYDIYVMDVDGTSNLRLTDAPGNDWAPNWSLGRQD